MAYEFQTANTSSYPQNVSKSKAKAGGVVYQHVALTHRHVVTWPHGILEPTWYSSLTGAIFNLKHLMFSGSKEKWGRA